MQAGDNVTVCGCRAGIPAEQPGVVTNVTPTGRVSVRLPDGRIVKFDATGFQLGREYPDYALGTPADER